MGQSIYLKNIKQKIGFIYDETYCYENLNLNYMKTKYSLAIVISHKAELILMDEPTSGLDSVFRSGLLQIIYH